MNHKNGKYEQRKGNGKLKLTLPVDSSILCYVCEKKESHFVLYIIETFPNICKLKVYTTFQIL